MSVFISYSHKDEAFVEKLGLALIERNIPIWRDKWQLGLGDSISGSIENALEKASFVCIVLSKNALNSDWVKREIEASLHLELEPNKLSILPLVIDDCKLPLFLRSKLYADFRDGFDSGLAMIINAVSDKYNLYSGSTTNNGKTTSFSTDVLKSKDSLEINMDVISEDDDCDYFILSSIQFIGNENALHRYEEYESNNMASNFIKLITKTFCSSADISNARMIIGGRKAASVSFSVSDDSNLSFSIAVNAKKVGPDNGKVVLFNLGEIFHFHQEIN